MDTTDLLNQLRRLSPGGYVEVGPAHRVQVLNEGGRRTFYQLHRGKQVGNRAMTASGAANEAQKVAAGLQNPELLKKANGHL